MPLACPKDIGEDPVQSAVWSQITTDAPALTERDIPLLRLLCFWHAVAAEARRQLGSKKPAILDAIAVKPLPEDEAGRGLMERKAPALAVLKEATAEIRALSDALCLTPSSRARTKTAGGVAPAAASDEGELLSIVAGKKPRRRKVAGR